MKFKGVESTENALISELLTVSPFEILKVKHRAQPNFIIKMIFTVA